MNRKRVRARFIVNLTGSRRQNGAFYADKMVALLICRKNAGALASSLEKRGFSATPLEITLGERTIAEALQETVASEGAQVLAMGGFGHSRIRDFILGGATKGVLTQLGLPTLLSH